MSSLPPVLTSILKVLSAPIIVLFGDTSPDATFQTQKKALVRNISLTLLVIFLCAVFGALNAAKSIEDAVNSSQKRVDRLSGYGFSAVLGLEEQRLLAHTHAYNTYVSKWPNRFVFKARGLTTKPLPVSSSTLDIKVVP